MASFERWRRFVDGILPSCTPYEFADKQNAVSTYILYMLDRTQSMFKWSGLPDSIPARMLEMLLQYNGVVTFYRVTGNDTSDKSLVDNVYAFRGAYGGERDIYYRPTLCVIANPRLTRSINARIGEDCSIMYNDSMFVGLLPMFARYATALAENDLSIDIASVNSRIQSLISASDDRTKASADEYLQNVRDGKLASIGENAFFDGIRVQPSATTGARTITDLIELEQYLKASWYNEIGLNANYNMKRESINSGESQLNNDALLPLVDDMLRQRREGAERLNSLFGLNVSVDLASSWEDNEIEIALEQEQTEPETDESEVSEDEKPTE